MSTSTPRVFTFALAKSAAAKFWNAFVNKVTAVRPAASGPKAVINAAPAALKPKEAPFAPAPAPKNPLESIGKALFASFNLLFVPFTVWLNFCAWVLTFFNAVIAWVAPTLSSTLETATT